MRIANILFIFLIILLPMIIMFPLNNHTDDSTVRLTKKLFFSTFVLIPVIFWLSGAVLHVFVTENWTQKYFSVQKFFARLPFINMIVLLLSFLLWVIYTL